MYMGQASGMVVKGAGLPPDQPWFKSWTSWLAFSLPLCLSLIKLENNNDNNK